MAISPLLYAMILLSIFTMEGILFAYGVIIGKKIGELKAYKEHYEMLIKLVSDKK